jgi:hypothetical protein
MPTIEFTDAERAALTAFLRDAIAEHRFPLSPRLRPIRSALDKLDPQPPRPPLAPPAPPGKPCSLLTRKRRNGRR